MQVKFNKNMFLEFLILKYLECFDWMNSSTLMPMMVALVELNRPYSNNKNEREGEFF